MKRLEKYIYILKEVKKNKKIFNENTDWTLIF